MEIHNLLDVKSRTELREWLIQTKTICMFTSSLVLLKVLALPEKMVFAIGFMMGWPQMVTGICGILLARLITKRTANF